MKITKKALKKVAAMRKMVAKFIADEGGHAFGPFPWVLPTSLGDLKVTMHDGDPSIFCRFEDTDRAVAYLGKDQMNHYSGKWNHHYYSVDWSAQEMFEYWAVQVKDFPARG